MRTKIKKTIILFVILFIFLIVANKLAMASDVGKKSEKVINIGIEKTGNNYSVKGIDVEFGEVSYYDNYKTFKNLYYTGTLISYKNQILGYFSIPNFTTKICFDTIGSNGKMTGGCKFPENGNIVIAAPYFPNAKQIDIYSPDGKKILSIDVSSKATCNENGKCDKPMETFNNCRVDCPTYEPIKPATTITDQNKPEPKKTTGLMSGFSWRGLGIILGGLILICLAVIFLLKIKKDKQI